MPHCFLSLQHWTQQSNDDSPRKHGTWCATYADTCQLYWKQNKYTNTVPFDYSTNTPKFMSAPSNKFFKTEARLLETESKSNTAESTISFCSEIRSKPEGRQQHDDEFLTDFLPDKSNKTIDLEADAKNSATTTKGEYLRWNHRLGYLADSKIKLLINAGILPKSLGKIHPPMCASCKAGAMTKEAWITKGN